MKSVAPFLAIACWAVIAASASAQSAAPPATTEAVAPPILWKFTRGQTLRYQRSENADIRRVEGELTYPVSESQHTLDIRWYVEQVDDDGTATITQTIERVRETKDGPKGKQETDSKKSRKGVFPLPGTKFKFSMSPHGRSSEVTLPSRLEKALEAQAPGELVAWVVQSLEQSMPGFLLPSDDSCRRQPWSHQTEERPTTLGLIKLTRQYDYAGQKLQPDGLAAEAFRISSSAESIADPRTPFRYSLDQFSGKGTIEFDAAAGRMLASIEQLRFDVTTTLGVRRTRLRVRGKTTWQLQDDLVQP